MASLSQNAITTAREIAWFSQVAVARGKLSFEHDVTAGDVTDILPPDVAGDPSPYAEVIREFGMSFEERFVLVLALLPHARPELLDGLFLKNPDTDRPYTQMGGQKGTAHAGYLPTGETAAFLLAGNDLEKRYGLPALFGEDHFFFRHNVLRLHAAPPGEPRLSGVLTLSDEYLARLTTGQPYQPDFSAQFPAKRLTTALDWDDLVVSEDLLDELAEVKAWLKYGATLLDGWGFGRKLKPGYRVLFTGPPGTGKTLTATLLGKSTGLDVYRVDLSMVVSKYIGETEKNLAVLFEKAENKRWILFFDEADALFGKRTVTKDAHDRHANQEVSYLLQRVEDFPGLVVLATNFPANLDDAFGRRFQAVLHFQKPDYGQRLHLWQAAFTPPLALHPEVNLEKIAYDYEITGGAILNVLRYCALKALERGDTQVRLPDLLHVIRKELHKEGKTVV